MLVRVGIALCLLAAFSGSSLFAQKGASAPSGLAIPATTSAINSPTPLSQRVVAYDMDAKYNAQNHSLDGTEILTYHNLTGQALDTFPFHLLVLRLALVGYGDRYNSHHGRRYQIDFRGEHQTVTF